MSTKIIPIILVSLTGCLNTQTKTDLKRPDFSAAPVTSGSCCGCGSCGKPKPQTCDPAMKPQQDLTTPPEPKKGKKVLGELPEYQAEDDGNF
jgi:hypothetical protein